jgi:DNA (cytosine-5)-methyltransferase 1
VLKVIELFAGVGGFRLGLEANNSKSNQKFKIVWSNQWEPSTKLQHASDVYKLRWPEDKHHNSEDIAKVIEQDFDSIPNHDLLVGGFPCQDYSVARTLSHAEGLKGKKGVLWWSIHAILKKKGKDAPKYLMLENVDRLLKSPTRLRGRDFAIMVASLSDLGYAVEWRVINAAEYGMPQRRRRVYIMAYKTDTSMHSNISGLEDASNWVTNNGIMQEAFPMQFDNMFFENWKIEGELEDISENNSDFNSIRRPFANAGIMINRNVYTSKGMPEYKGKYTKLKDILLDEKQIASEYFISNTDLEKWEYLKGSKREKRTTKSGHEYSYNEGPVGFPDSLDKPSRTIITGEGGRTPSRFKHVVETKSGKLRRLTPIELERLNMFPDRHTEGAGDTKRAFFMGNALVVGVVKKLGKSLAERDSL